MPNHVRTDDFRLFVLECGKFIRSIFKCTNTSVSKENKGSSCSLLNNYILSLNVEFARMIHAVVFFSFQRSQPTR